MITPQRKISSGYGAGTTAQDVLTNIDLTGQLAVVTGGHSGLGLETTRALSGAGADVVVGARRPCEARPAVTGLSDVKVVTLDLGDQDSIRSFADRLLALGRPIDILINSAGIMACPEARVGPGWEAQFGVNHLGHYALVNRLWPLLQPDRARVVSVSSAGHHLSGIRWNDIHFAEGYDKWQAYGQSKTANALFARQLDTLGASVGVRAFSLHPGSIFTPLQRHLAWEEMAAAGWVDENGAPIDPTFKTPEQGAATQVWAATSPQLSGMGGVYCEDCDIAEPAPTDGEVKGVHPWAADAEQAARLWKLSAELTGVDAFD